MGLKWILAATTALIWSAPITLAQGTEPSWARDQYICAAPNGQAKKLQITQILADGNILNYVTDVNMASGSFDGNLIITFFLNRYCTPGSVQVHGAWCCLKR